MEVKCTCSSSSMQVFSSSLKLYKTLGISATEIIILWNPEANFVIVGILLVLLIVLGIVYSYATDMDELDAEIVSPKLFHLGRKHTV